MGKFPKNNNHKKDGQHVHAGRHVAKTKNATQANDTTTRNNNDDATGTNGMRSKLRTSIQAPCYYEPSDSSIEYYYETSDPSIESDDDDDDESSDSSIESDEDDDNHTNASDDDATDGSNDVETPTNEYHSNLLKNLLYDSESSSDDTTTTSDVDATKQQIRLIQKQNRRYQKLLNATLNAFATLQEDDNVPTTNACDESGPTNDATEAKPTTSPTTDDHAISHDDAVEFSDDNMTNSDMESKCTILTPDTPDNRRKRKREEEEDMAATLRKFQKQKSHYKRLLRDTNKKFEQLCQQSYEPNGVLMGAITDFMDDFEKRCVAFAKQKNRKPDNMAESIVNNLFHSNVLNGLIQTKMIDAVKIYLRQNTFHPNKIIELMKLHEGYIPTTALRVLRLLEMDGPKESTGRKIFSSTSVILRTRNIK